MLKVCFASQHVAYTFLRAYAHNGSVKGVGVAKCAIYIAMGGAKRISIFYGTNYMMRRNLDLVAIYSLYVSIQAVRAYRCYI